MDRICAFLEEDDKSLSSLRLTCKAFVQSPEKYLYSTVYLVARIDSIEYLERLSQHPRLSSYVTAIRMEAEPVFEDLSKRQWDSMVASYSERLNRRSLRHDYMSAMECYFKTFATLYSQFNQASARCAYEQYSFAYRRQNELVQLDEAVVHQRLWLAFRRLPRLLHLDCTLGESSKYYDVASPDHIRPSLLKTLAAPQTLYELNDNQPDTAKVLSAAMSAMFRCPMSSSLLAGVLPWKVLRLLSTSSSGPGTNDTGFSSLRELCIHMDFWCRGGDVDTDRDSQTLTSILSRVPNLESLDYRCDVSLYDESRLVLPRDLDSVSLSQLKYLNLAGVGFEASRFLHLIKTSASTLRDLRLDNVYLHGHRWVDVFSEMRECQLTETFIGLGMLFEIQIADGVDMEWRFDWDNPGWDHYPAVDDAREVEVNGVCEDRSLFATEALICDDKVDNVSVVNEVSQSLHGHRYLLDEVVAWLNWSTEQGPLRPTHAGGSVTEWRHKSNEYRWQVYREYMGWN